MNIFVGGIHGVGKTFLASQLPASSGLSHSSASRLIQEARDANWGSDKLVADIGDNQTVFAQAIAERNSKGDRLLLDGHFVLIGKEREYLAIDVGAFATFNLSAAVLIEADPHTVARRVRSRDGTELNLDNIAEFSALEHRHAEHVCRQLSIPLYKLYSPDLDTFTSTIKRLSSAFGW